MVIIIKLKIWILGFAKAKINNNVSYVKLTMMKYKFC